MTNNTTSALEIVNSVKGAWILPFPTVGKNVKRAMDKKTTGSFIAVLGLKNSSTEIEPSKVKSK